MKLQELIDRLEELKKDTSPEWKVLVSDNLYWREIRGASVCDEGEIQIDVEDLDKY